MRKSNKRAFGRAVILGAVSFQFSSRLFAQVDGLWTTGSGSWSNASKWSSNPLIPDGGGVATFSCTLPGVNVIPRIEVDTNISLSKLAFTKTPYLPWIQSSSGHS